MGQRAPNRAGVTEDVSQRLQNRRDENGGSRRQGTGRPRDDEGQARGGDRDRYHDRHGPSSARGGDGRVPADRSGVRETGHNNGADRDRDRDRDRRAWGSGTQDRGGGRDTRDRRGYDRDSRDSRERDGGRGRDAWPSRDSERGGHPPRSGRDWRGAPDSANERDRDRGRAASSVFGRSAADVFGKCKAPAKDADGVDGFYGDADMGFAAPISQGEDGVRIGRRR